jgi:hypothetical protein
MTLSLEEFQLAATERSKAAFDAASKDLDLNEPQSNELTVTSLALAYAVVCHGLNFTEEGVVEGIKTALQVVRDAVDS